MQIQKILLRNFCQHQNLEATFSPYMNLVCGPNGSGKSNLFRAILLLMCGDAGGVCRKDENVCQLIDRSAAAYVEGTVSHGGHMFEIRRGLRGSTSWLSVDGHKKTESTKEITKMLFDYLGCDEFLFKNYIVVPQREIDVWIDQTQTERAESWSKLFGLNKAMSIHEQLGRAVAALGLPSVSGDETQYLQILEQEQARQATINEAMKAYFWIPEDLAAFSNVRTLKLNVYQQLVHLKASIAHYSNQLPALKLKAEQSLQQHTDDKAGVEGLRAVMDELSVASDKAKDELKACQARRMFEQQILAREQTWRTLIQKAKARPLLPVKLTEAASYDALRVEIAKWADWSEKITNEVNNLRNELAIRICSRCKQPLPNLAEMEKRLSEALPQQQEIDKELQTKLQTQSKITAYLSARARIMQTRVAIRSEIRQFNKLPIPAEVMCPVVDEAACRNIVNDYQQLTHDYTAAKKRCSELEITSCLDKQQVASVEAELDRLNKEMLKVQTHNISETEAIRLQQEIQDAQTGYQQRAGLRVQLASAQAAAKAAQDNLDRFRSDREKKSKVLNTVRVLSAVRDIYHHDEAPRKVSSAYLSKVQTDINGTLEIFSAPFRAYADESMGFTCPFFDGREVVDKRLSGGERVVLGLSTRMSINTLRAGPLGLWILDEPTEGLDEHNLGCLPMALSRLRDLSQAHGLQVLFVTHMQRLSYLFDHVVKIGNYETEAA